MRATELPSAIILTGCGQYDGQGVYCGPSTIPLRCFLFSLTNYILPSPHFRWVVNVIITEKPTMCTESELA